MDRAEPILTTKMLQQQNASEKAQERVSTSFVLVS